MLRGLLSLLLLAACSSPATSPPTTPTDSLDTETADSDTPVVVESDSEVLADSDTEVDSEPVVHSDSDAEEETDLPFLPDSGTWSAVNGELLEVGWADSGAVDFDGGVVPCGPANVTVATAEAEVEAAQLVASTLGSAAFSLAAFDEGDDLLVLGWVPFCGSTGSYASWEGTFVNRRGDLRVYWSIPSTRADVPGRPFVGVTAPAGPYRSVAAPLTVVE